MFSIEIECALYEILLKLESGINVIKLVSLPNIDWLILHIFTLYVLLLLIVFLRYSVQFVQFEQRFYQQRT